MHLSRSFTCAYVLTITGTIDYYLSLYKTNTFPLLLTLLACTAYADFTATYTD